MRLAWTLPLLAASACAAAAKNDPWDREMHLSRRTVAPSSTEATAAKKPRLPPPPAEEKVAAIVAHVSSEVRLYRATLDGALAQGPRRFMDGVTLDPFFLDKKFVGWALTRFYDGDARFAGVDLRRGDVVLRVNGQAIGRPDQFMRVWEDLRTADEIRVEYLRGAEKRVLKVRIVE